MYGKHTTAVFLGALCIMASSAARAELDPDATVQSAIWHTEEHPITGTERIDFMVTTRQHGDFSNLIRIYVELVDEAGEKYTATSEGKFFDNYGDRQLTRISHFYLKDDGKLKVKAYWIGFYFIDDTGEHLLSSKSRKIDDLAKWKEASQNYTAVEVELGSTELRPAD